MTTPTSTTSGASSALLSSIAYLVVGLIILGGLWWVFIRRRSGQSLPSQVPPVPPAPLPTPPAPPGNTTLPMSEMGRSSGNVDIPGPPSTNNPV